MSEKVDEYAIDLDGVIFPVDDSVFGTDTALTNVVRPDPNLPTSTSVSITGDTEYNLISGSLVQNTTFDYDATATGTSKLVFKGWGSATGSGPGQLTSNNFNFATQPVNLIFGEYLVLTGNTFNLGAGSVFQLTTNYNNNATTAIAAANRQGFVNNIVALGDNSQFGLVLDDGYFKQVQPGGNSDASGNIGPSINAYQFTGNTLTFGNNSDINLDFGKGAYFNDKAGALTNVSYSNNTFNLGENNTLNFGETYSAAENNIINAGTGSTINFNNDRTDAYNVLTYGNYQTLKAVNSLSQGNFSALANSWGLTNNIVYGAGVTNVTVNVAAGVNINFKTWNTGINGTVNFSGQMNTKVLGSDPSRFTNVLTTVNVQDGSSFNISGETTSINLATFNLGKGASLNIASDVLLPTSSNYAYFSHTQDYDTKIGTIINTDGSTLFNAISGVFNSTVNFADGDATTTLTIGNLSLTGGKELTYLLTLNGLDEDHGRILLENLNGFQIDKVDFFNQSAEGAAANANAYVKFTFINDAGETAVMNIKMDVHGKLHWVPVTDSAGNIVSYYVSVCFHEGTLIQTIDGEKAVETLKRGDLVKTKDGMRGINWVGHKKKKLNSFSKKEDFLVLIKKDALADNVPCRDLRVTAEHCLYVEGKLIPARMLVNGKSIIYDLEITDYTIWHVECAKHQVIFAENVAVESYLDTGNRYTFEGCGNVSLIPHCVNKRGAEAVADLCTDMSFVEPIWKEYQQRAIGLNFPESIQVNEEENHPNIYLCTDNGQAIYPLDVQDQVYTFALDKPTDFVSIMSYVSSPEEVYGSFVDDRRKLGIAVGYVQIVSCDGEEMMINHHLDKDTVVGWYDLEGQGVQYRWTKGCAYLPLQLTHKNDQKYKLRIQIISTLPKYFKETVRYDFLFKKVS